MAVYEYLCLKCRDEFELMRPMSEAEKPAICTKCGSEAHRLMSGFRSRTEDSMQPAGEPFDERTVVGDVGLADSDGKGRNTVQKSLLQQLGEVADKLRLLERDKGEAATRMEGLEREKNEAVAKTRALEREVGEMAALITMAGEKVGEILNIGANDEIPQPPEVNMPEEPKGRMHLGESSADPQKQPKRLLPQVFIPD
jgi:putative FmdB family regulatory protein